MDPNATLARIREILKLTVERDLDADATADALDELSNQVEDLDKWITGGGFLPAAWEEV